MNTSDMDGESGYKVILELVDGTKVDSFIADNDGRIDGEGRMMVWEIKDGAELFSVPLAVIKTVREIRLEE